jgi:FlaA1/EpsC-like NDP-sugar epimerase
MKLWNAKSRRWIIFAHDMLLCTLAWFLAFSLRHNFEAIPQEELSSALAFLPALWIVQTYSFYKLKTYRALWRYMSVQDLFQLLQAALATTVVMSVSIYVINGFFNTPRSVMPLYLVNAMALMCLPRLLNRLYRDSQSRDQGLDKALIVGAGSAGERLLRDFKRREQGKYQIIGFVDDDQYKKGQKIHNVSVLGPTSKLPRLIVKHEIDQVFIAIPSATSKQMREIVSLCEQTPVKINTLPSLQDIVAGKVTIDNLKGVSIEDLLGRIEHQLDQTEIAERIDNKVVLVTGAGGSIGSELTRQIARMNPKTLLLVDHSEYNLYQISQELSQSESCDFVALLGSITDREFLEGIFSHYQIDNIYHAAAYKHVPLLEEQIRSAVLNNVIGTYYLSQLAIQHEVNYFTMISTDKAVNPTNLMGATKRIAEMICQTASKNAKTNFSIVRFGNVLGSQGSVLPLFKQQLADGGPLTVTHPDITRYFMSIPEAANLILQSTLLNSDGHIFVLDMGEPIKILYLAEQIIRLSGREPYRDVDIIFTGLRPGEKMYEELFYEQEQLIPTQINKVFISNGSLVQANLDEIIRALIVAINVSELEKIVEITHKLVPTYSHDMEPFAAIDRENVEYA